MATYSQVCSAVGNFGYASRFTLYVVLTNRDGNSASNKSWVDYNVYFQNTSGGGTFTSNTRLYFALNGGVIKDSTSSITGPRNGSVSIASGSIQVDHNNDGTKAIGYHALVNSTSYGIYGEISGNFTLSTIPRASSVSGGSGNIGQETTISISRASTSFTHKLTYKFGNLSETIATGVGDSHKWTIPTSFYTQIPNDPSGVGTIYCDTYSGSTLIGSKNVGFTATASKDSSRPTVTGTVVDTNEKTIALTGNPNKLISGKSTAKITVTPTVKNSATLKSVTIDGISTSDNTRTIANVTKTSFPVVVVDSRGYDNIAYSATASGGIVDYIPLTISAKVFRPQPTGKEIQLTYSGNYFNGSFGAKQNSMGMEWYYKVKGASDWTKGGTITPTISGNTISEKTISLGTNYDYQTAYEFYVYAQDQLTSVSTTMAVSVGMPVFYWGKDFFNITGNITINAKKQGGNVPIGAGLYSGNFNNVDAEQELNKNFMGSLNDGNMWYNVINVRHRNGDGDGTKFGLQIKDPMSTVYPTLQIRHQANSSWGGWFDIPVYTVLYDNSSGTTGTVTLSVNASNFKYIDIFYSHDPASFGYKSVRLHSPNGKTAGLDLVEGQGPYMATYVAHVAVNGTSVSFSRGNGMSIYGVNFTLAGFVQANEIKIYKVVGYR